MVWPQSCSLQCVLKGFHIPQHEQQRLVLPPSEVHIMKGAWGGDKAKNSVHHAASEALRGVDKVVLVAALDAVVSVGAALLVGSTRDGGAVNLTLMNGNDRIKVFCANADELTAALADLRDSFKPAHT